LPQNVDGDLVGFFPQLLLLLRSNILLLKKALERRVNGSILVFAAFTVQMLCKLQRGQVHLLIGYADNENGFVSQSIGRVIVHYLYKLKVVNFISLLALSLEKEELLINVNFSEVNTIGKLC
jgi:hypothetical protein